MRRAPKLSDRELFKEMKRYAFEAGWDLQLVKMVQRPVYEGDGSDVPVVTTTIRSSLDAHGPASRDVAEYLFGP